MTVKTRSGIEVSAPLSGVAYAPLIEVLSDDLYRLDEMDWSSIEEPFVILDIGAHVGTFSITMAHTLLEAQIVCVEPMPDTVEWLRRNLQVNDVSSRSVIIPVAVSSSDAIIEMWVDQEASCEASMVPIADQNPIRVQSKSLSSIIASLDRSPNIVKMDCEGGEYDAILESPDWCWRTVELLFMEYHPHPSYQYADLKTRLAELGLFEMWTRLLGQSGVGMALFSRRPTVFGARRRGLPALRRSARSDAVEQ